MSINPFTLKELRQLTRSRTITGGLIFFLFASVAATYLIPLGGITSRTGQNLAACIQTILGLLFTIVLPINVFVRMMKERRGKTAADLTLVTPLPPSSVIDGKLCSAFTLMFLMASASLPFGVAAYLMHGVTFVDMAKSLLLIAAVSGVGVMVAILIASLRVSSVFRVVLFIVVMFFASQFSLLGSILSSEMGGAMPLEDFCVTLAVCLTFGLLLRAYAVAFITPKVMNRDFAIRSVVLVAAVGWVAYVIVNGWGDPPHDFANSVSVMVYVVLLSLALIAVGSAGLEAGYSIRQLAARPASSVLRVLVWPFRTGTVNGIFFALVLGGLFLTVLPLVSPHLEELIVRWKLEGDSIEECRKIVDFTMMFGFFVYEMAMVMIVRGLWYPFRRRIIPAFVPGIAIFVFVMIQTIPALMEVYGRAIPSIIPFSFFSVSKSLHDHVFLAAGALVLGLALMLPEIIASFKGKSRA